MAIEHIEEFEYYYNLGSKRTYTAVAKNFNVGLTSVHRWATSEGWKEEVEERNLAYLKQVKRNLYKRTEKTLNTFNFAVNKTLQHYIKQIEAGKIKIESVEDLDKLTKILVSLGGYNISLIDNSLLGFESYSNTDTENQSISIQTIKTMDQLLNSLKENIEQNK